MRFKQFIKENKQHLNEETARYYFGNLPREFDNSIEVVGGGFNKKRWFFNIMTVLEQDPRLSTNDSKRLMRAGSCEINIDFQDGQVDVDLPDFDTISRFTEMMSTVDMARAVNSLIVQILIYKTDLEKFEPKYKKMKGKFGSTFYRSTRDPLAPQKRDPVSGRTYMSPWKISSSLPPHASQSYQYRMDPGTQQPYIRVDVQGEKTYTKTAETIASVFLGNKIGTGYEKIDYNTFDIHVPRHIFDTKKDSL